MIEFKLNSISRIIGRDKTSLWDVDANKIAISASNFADILRAFSALDALEASAFLAYAMPVASPKARFFGKAMLACRNDRVEILKEYRAMVKGE